MAPALHQRYSADEAVAAFGGDGRPEWFCDGEFAVLPSVVLGLATVGRSDEETHLASPSNLDWRPRPGAEPTYREDWLPEPVMEVWDRSGGEVRKIRDHHLLLRAPGDDRFLYAGEAHLGALTYYRGPVWAPAAHFSLGAKLPRDAWLALGGYSGWLVEVDHASRRVDAGDLATFERLACALTERSESHLSLTRYEEDVLTVYTNATRGRLTYQRHLSAPSLATRDPYDASPADSFEVFGCVCGIDLECPTAQTLPRELAVQAAAEFFRTGQLPRCVPWDVG